MIMFAVRPICIQDSIFQMSSASPGWFCLLTTDVCYCTSVWFTLRYILFYGINEFKRYAVIMTGVGTHNSHNRYSQRPGNVGKLVECDKKLTMPVEYHNECLHQIWGQYPEQFAWKCAETTKCDGRLEGWTCMFLCHPPTPLTGDDNLWEIQTYFSAGSTKSFAMIIKARHYLNKEMLIKWYRWVSVIKT